MPDIEINGQTRQLPGEQLALTALLQSEAPADGGFAVAVNEAFVPKSQYETVCLQSGDRVEILRPIQGG